MLKFVPSIDLDLEIDDQTLKKRDTKGVKSFPMPKSIL